MDRESLELLLGQGLSLEQIARRFGKRASTVSYWLEQCGLRAVNREKHAAKGGIEREYLEGLVEAGMSIAEIAVDVKLSKASVRYWLRRHGLRTSRSVGRPRGELAREARDAGLLTVMMICAHHGESEFLLEGRGYYRCKQCRVSAVARRRRKVKEILVEEADGQCSICGYSRCLGALAFHHLDPTEKRLEINAKGVALALGTLREEARKCVLLCANCHAEVENGMTTLAATVRAR